MARLRALVVAGAVVLAVGACSGDGSPQAGSDRPAEGSGGEPGVFVAEANAICATLGEQRLGLTPPSAPSEVADYAAEAEGFFSDAIDGLARLNPPADKRQVFDDLVGALRTQLDTLRAVADLGADASASELDSVVSQSAEAVITSREAVFTLDLAACVDVL